MGRIVDFDDGTPEAVLRAAGESVGEMRELVMCWTDADGCVWHCNSKMDGLKAVGMLETVKESFVREMEI